MKWEQRLRHRRGYGVHSPFLYEVVRSTMMPRKMTSDDRRLYDALRNKGVDHRSATRLQNYLLHVGYECWTIDQCPDNNQAKVLCIATRQCPTDELERLLNACQEHKEEATLCVFHRSKEAKAECNRLVEQHSSMSAEKPRFTLFFHHRPLPKQHLII